MVPNLEKWVPTREQVSLWLFLVLNYNFFLKEPFSRNFSSTTSWHIKASSVAKSQTLESSLCRVQVHLRKDVF